MLEVNEVLDEKMICFQNGVFFIKDREFFEFSDQRVTNLIFSNKIPFEYSSKARDIPENWKHFLKTLLKWETVKSEDILAVIIAQIMGLVNLQLIYYLGGAPRSDKSL